MKAIIPVEILPKLHVTPLASIICDSPKVIVEADDENEARIRFIFEPYQAVRMITADCFSAPEGVTITPQIIVEIHNSIWVSELRSTLKKTDCEADFMDKARHFLLPLQDDFLEIVAWNVIVEIVT
jgi:hypothetical protein